MTFLDACDLIDKELSQLKKRNKFGEIDEGIEAMAYVYHLLGDEADKPQDDLETGRTSIDEYAERMVDLIRKCSEMDQNRLIEKKLRDLHLDQVELELVSKLFAEVDYEK